MQAYCSNCGEKRPDRDDWKLTTIGGEAVSELTELEHSKLWQTLKLVVFKPGQLTREYWRGRRKVFLGPVKLYLVFFALSLVVYSIHQPTAVYDVRTYATADPEGRLARQLDEMASKASVPSEQVAAEINSRMQTYISWSQLLYPLLVALTLKLLFLRHGRYFAEHLIFALHLLVFTLFAMLVMWPLYFLLRLGDQSVPSLTSPVYMGFTAASTLWIAAYMMLALLRAYDASWAAAVVKGAVVFFVYVLVSMVCVMGAVFLAVVSVNSARL